METVHEGGCLCGDVRYAVRGEPLRASVCHCAYCRRRSGSAFGLHAFFADAAVTFTGAAPATWRHISDESGRWLDHSFCPRCGTPIGLRVERVPGQQGFVGGSFDDPAWFAVRRQIWTRSGLPWVRLPADWEQLEKG
jgi:hypothetical protein